MPLSVSYLTDGFILSRHDWKNWDRMYSIITPEGRKEFRAIGSRRPHSKLAGRLEPWQSTRIMVIRGRNSDILADSRPELGWHILRKNFPTFFFAAAYAELVDKLIPLEEPSEEVFLAVRRQFDLLRDLAHGGVTSRKVWRSWWLSASGEIISFAGIYPENTTYDDPEALQWWLTGILDKPLASFPLLRTLL